MRIALFLLLTISFSSFAQRQKPKNYSRYDNRTFHFGMMIGGNSSDFTVFQKMNAHEEHGLKSLVNTSSAGGQFGPLVSVNLGTPIVRLRFIPTFSFQERILDYTFESNDPAKSGDFLNQERVNSSNFEFPLMLQFRTLRFNNFATYVLMGGQYSWDMQSQAKASQDYIDPFIKLKSHDWQAQLGGGVEFFFPYFKFGLEVKYSQGLINSFIQDDTFIAAPIDRLYNKVWSVSIVIEG